MDATRAQNEIPEINFGPTITDTDLVEDRIRQAQLAILNPTLDASFFLSYTLVEDEESERARSRPQQLAFSRNVIVLEISGQKVSDLSLVDLLGLISNVGVGEDRNNIQLVEDLVTSYIDRDCLILLVITMKGKYSIRQSATQVVEADQRKLMYR